MVATSLSRAGSIIQVRRAFSWPDPAASRADSRPSGPRSAARLLSVRAAQARWWGRSTSGQIQEILRRLCRFAAVREPGQYGSRVWSVDSTLRVVAAWSWAVAGETPYVLMPAVLTWDEAVQ